MEIQKEIPKKEKNKPKTVDKTIFYVLYLYQVKGNKRKQKS